MIFQITDDEIKQQPSLFDFKVVSEDLMQSYLFFSIELKGAGYTRGQLSGITRFMNRLYDMPVMVIFKYEWCLTFAIINRRPSLKDSQKSVLEKITLIKDISIGSPHRAHIEILFDLSIDELQRKYGFADFDALHKAWQKTLDTKELNKQFYQKLFNWYLWALRHAKFPQMRPAEEMIPDNVHQSESLIRLLTRLLFVWFMKEKGLINPDLFEQNKLKHILKNFRGEEGNETIYYKAVLQNLFFATLNRPIDQRKPIDKRKTKNPEYGDPLVYRYEDHFAEPGKMISYFGNIPFLNGGLFDCLDQRKDADNPVEIRLDGFSTKKVKQPVMPDKLFFGEYRNIDLSTDYDDKKKNHLNVFGLIDILQQYKFTIEENTPVEEEVALDPELLGKVFENLLASYNPETQTTARKQTGSFYTPREIVNYMVDESLIAYLKNHVDDEERLRKLFSYKECDGENSFNKRETGILLKAIDNCKILDPACGSGAFPMGVLQKMIHILHKLDPDNSQWFEMVISNFPAYMQPEVRKKLEKENWNYVRKLGIIQQCIYGVDIQPIATQIAKLRFFISLLVDQREKPGEENRGFEPLPNLDFKIVTANTLIPAPASDAETTGLFAGQTDQFFEEFDRLTNLYFSKSDPADKKELKNQITRIIKEKCNQKIKQIESKFEHADEKASKALKEKHRKFIEEKEREVKLWQSYPNLFKYESVVFFEPKYFFPKVKDGFDVVIGNPPYGISFSENDINFFRRNYEVIIGHSEAYYLFIEKGLKLLRQDGSLAYITPNSWYSNKYARGVRKWILYKSKIRILINLNRKFVFENAGVEAAIFILSNSNSGIRDFPLVGNDIVTQCLYKYDHSNWLENEFNNISFTYNTVEDDIVKLIQDSNKISDFLDISNGFKPYQVGYGINLKGLPLDEDDVKNKIYNCSYKKTKEYKPQLKGKNVSRYFFEFTNEYIKWGNWLMSPKDKKYFENDKILIRQITGKTFYATLDKEKYYADQTLYIATNYDPPLISLEYCVALFNSKILGYYFRKFYSAEDLLFPKIKVNELKNLPLKRFDESVENKISSLANYILIRKKLSNDKEDIYGLFFEQLIDSLFYELYLFNDNNNENSKLLHLLKDLPPIKEDWSDEKKLEVIDKIHKELSNPSHPISVAMEKMHEIEEVKIIEGRG